MIHTNKPSATAQAQPAIEDNPCFILMRMNTNGELPKGFPYEQACSDMHFMELCRQYDTEAAVAIYMLETERDQALSSARDEVQQTLRKRSAMPVQRRADAPLSGDVDCWQMTDEEFRAYDQAMQRQRQAARANQR